MAEYLELPDRVSALASVKGAVTGEANANDVVAEAVECLLFAPSAGANDPAGECRTRLTVLTESVKSADLVSKLLNADLQRERRQRERAEQESRRVETELEELKEKFRKMKWASRRAYDRSLSECTNPDCDEFEDHNNPGSAQPHGFRKCAKCKMAKYCSKGCQVHDWEHHRRKCCAWTSRRRYNLGNDDADDILGRDEYGALPRVPPLLGAVLSSDEVGNEDNDSLSHDTLPILEGSDDEAEHADREGGNGEDDEGVGGAQGANGLPLPLLLFRDEYLEVVGRNGLMGDDGHSSDEETLEEVN